jgi:hypothetical protein
MSGAAMGPMLPNQPHRLPPMDEALNNCYSHHAAVNSSRTFGHGSGSFA